MNGLERWQRLPEAEKDRLYDEREGPQLEAMRAYEESPSFGTLYGCHEDCAHAAHYGLLKFFDEHEPELADAIRYGLKTRAWQKDGELGFGRAEAAETQLYVIDKPDSEPT